MILIKNMSKPKQCIDCPIHKISYQDADGYGENYDWCGALKREFNHNKLDINPFKETLSDCPIIEVKDESQTERSE